MSENMTPELTLNPTETETTVPELTLDPTAVAEAPQEKPVEPVQLDDKLLTEQEKKAVEEFSKKIDITDTNMPAVRRRRPEERGGLLRERPEQCAQQGPGRGGR